MLPEYVTRIELAKILGISPIALDKFEHKGLFQKAGRGKYPFPESVQAIHRHLREIAAGRASASVSEDGVDLVTERALLAREQRHGISFKNAVQRGEYLKATEVISWWASAFSAVRAAMMGLPSDISVELPHLTRHDLQILDRAIRDKLHDVADGLGADGNRSGDVPRSEEAAPTAEDSVISVD